MVLVSVSSSGESVRRAFVRLGVLLALVVFVGLGSDVLLTQWISGNTTGKFILGTAALIAGISAGLFAFIAATGLVVAVIVDWVVSHRPASNAAHLADHTRNAI